MSHYPQRKSPRLQGYNYSEEGAYFITLCTFNRVFLFGQIRDAIMTPGEIGQIAADCWFNIPAYFPQIELDAFVVMPNHIHGIMVINYHAAGTPYNVTATHDQTLTLGKIINVYKGAVTRLVNRQISNPVKIWQGRYHDHIIRDERGLNYIRDYVYHNPERWQRDIFYA